MGLSEGIMFAYLMVFMRAGAMLLSAPVFGAHNTPLPIRIFTTMGLTAALTGAVAHGIGKLPDDMYGLIAGAAHEIFVGLLIGTFISMVTQIAQIAGGLLDFQVGLGSGQILNPVSGVEVTMLAQYKFMLGVVIFLCSNAHLVVIRAFIQSYDAMPGLSDVTLPQLEHNFIQLITHIFFIAIQIAAPVLAVSLLVDGAFGLISRAVPQMQITHVGLPAKLGLGLIAVSFGLPALTVGVSAGVNEAMIALQPILAR